MQATHQRLTASMLLLTCAPFSTFACASNIHTILGENCGGDDPRDPTTLLKGDRLVGIGNPYDIRTLYVHHGSESEATLA